MSGRDPAPRRERKPRAEDSGDSLRADARRNREELLRVARELFASQGLEVGIDEVARRAGVGVGTVYRHFPTKEALFTATVMSHVEELLDYARSLADAPNAGQAFFTFLERLMEQGVAKKNLIDILSRSGAKVKVQASSPELSREFRRAVGVLLTRAQEAGAVRAPLEVSDLIALLSGVATAVQSQGGDASTRRRLFDVVRDGIRREHSSAADREGSR
jgi:AcrR family transcriptional regulator